MLGRRGRREDTKLGPLKIVQNRSARADAAPPSRHHRALFARSWRAFSVRRGVLVARLFDAPQLLERSCPDLLPVASGRLIGTAGPSSLWGYREPLLPRREPHCRALLRRRDRPFSDEPVPGDTLAQHSSQKTAHRRH